MRKQKDILVSISEWRARQRALQDLSNKARLGNHEAAFELMRALTTSATEERDLLNEAIEEIKRLRKHNLMKAINGNRTR